MKKRKKIVIFGIIIFVIIVLIFFLFTKFQENKIEKLENKIQLLKTETIPFRFKIIEKTPTKIHFAIKFYDLDGNVINRKEFTVSGQELSFDFYVIPIKDRYIAFPYKIFTNKIAPEKGKLLFSLYDKNDFPQIYYSKNINTDLKDGLSALFVKIKNMDIEELQGIFGSGIQDIKGIHEFKENQIYKVILHTKGGIEIIEE